MHMRRLALAAASAALLPFGAAHAADITWSLGPSFGGVNGHLGILTNGTLVEAVHLTGINIPPIVVDPGGLNMSFTQINSTAFETSFVDPSNGIGDPAWADIVRYFEWSNAGDVTTDTLLTGLTPGNTYQVQLFAGRSHTCCGNRTQRFGDGNGNFSDPIPFTPLSFISVVGTFVADAASQTLVFDDSNNTPILSAFVLRDVSAVPEPGTWALMLGGLAATGALARRRRAP